MILIMQKKNEFEFAKNSKKEKIETMRDTTKKRKKKFFFSKMQSYDEIR